MSAEQATRGPVGPNLRGIQRYTGDESVAPVDRCDEQDRVQSCRPEHCMAKGRCLHLRKWWNACYQRYGKLILLFYSWKLNIMYVASFHLRLFYRLNRHGLDSDPGSSSTGVDTV